LQQLTNNPSPEFDPMWSPDGKCIVYRDSSRGPNRDDEIIVMNADGSGQINLTNNPANDWVLPGHRMARRLSSHPCATTAQAQIAQIVAEVATSGPLSIYG
jgi:hypothetical protein